MNVVENQNLSDRESELKTALKNLEIEKELAERARIDGLYNELADCKKRADAYRKQAAKTDVQQDKLALYDRANEADEQAERIARELGIQETEADQQTVRADYAQRVLKRLLKTCGWLFVGYMISDYGAGYFESGFVAFVLKHASDFMYMALSFVGAYYLTGSVLKPILLQYVAVFFQDDLDAAGPTVRLIIVTALVATSLIVLAVLAPVVHQ